LEKPGGSAAQALKAQLSAKVDLILQHQSELENMKLKNEAPSVQHLKDALNKTAGSLVETQEILRGIAAMG